MDPTTKPELSWWPSSEAWKTLFTAAGVCLSVISFIYSQRANARAKKSASAKELLGEKEYVAFAALKLLRDKKLPEDKEERQMVISALLQACVFEGSRRTRALLYRVVDHFRDAH